MAAYRLEVNWLVAGSSSVQDLVQTLYKKAYKLGLRLAQVMFMSISITASNIYSSSISSFPFNVRVIIDFYAPTYTTQVPEYVSSANLCIHSFMAAPFVAVAPDDPDSAACLMPVSVCARVSGLGLAFLKHANMLTN